MESKLIDTSLKDRVTALNRMIMNGEILTAFDKFYAENVTMQENEDQPTIGKTACRINEEVFVKGITEFRSAVVQNVIISDEISVVEWKFDFTHKDWGTRNFTQVSIQRWYDGQIVNEKFYYNK
ncbi:SnoaL-like domain-containing protein [Reichenbachiella versicolor]|uniref:SnoaL-like domain-containing protein n=1 Tax=Reichenbachiella versicolor TaxID=1821036 RepID=UPI000D6DE3BF|nr:SnoaL-like domain-containing protein [Reichenbachiella versicolor]